MKQLLFICVLLAAIGLRGQTRSADLRLYITGTVPEKDYIEIRYDITAPGFVELHLMDASGKKLWIKGKVTDRKGLDYIRVPRAPLKPGERYPYILKYKGKDYSGTLYSS